MKRGGILWAAALNLAVWPAARAAAAPEAPMPPSAVAPAETTGPAVTLTLEEAIRTALANNPNLQATQGQQRQARTRIGQARAAAGPSLDATAGYVRQGPTSSIEIATAPGQPPQRVTIGSPQTRTGEIGATYRPDLSGRTSASVGIARAGAEAAEAVTAATINDLTQQVQNAYYTTLRTDTLVEVRRQAVGAAQEQLRVAQAEVRAGTKPQFDALRASVQVENQRQNLIVAENNARIARANLVNILGIDPNTRVQLTPVPVAPLPPPLPPGGAAGQAPGTTPAPAPTPGRPAPAEPRTVIPAPPERPTTAEPAPLTPSAAASAAAAAAGAPGAAPLPTTLEAAFAEAVARRPEVQEAREEIRRNAAQVQFERRARRPELALSGAYTRTPDASGFVAQDYQWRLGANLSLNLFDAGLIRSRVRGAQAGRDAAEARLEEAQQRVAQQVRTALLNLNEASERRATTAANVQQAQEALRIAQVRYRAGVGTNVEVTDAQVALIEAQTNQVNAEYDYLDAHASLERALGRYAPPTTGRAAPPEPRRETER